MRSWIARRMLRATSKRYGYDTSYLEMMLEHSPTAFFKFASLMKAAGHREVVPVDASFAAKLVGALAEDCGPCTQLCVDMALEAGMPKDQIEAVLRRNPRAMNSATILGFRFADAVVRRSADDEEFRDAIRAQWGEKGVIDLTLALQMGRMFDAEGLAADAATELADDLAFDLLLALDRLSPLERAAFLLHDVFDKPFSEVARMLDRTEAACRQLATRARRAVRDARPAPTATPDNHARLLSAFSEAVASGDVSRLAGLLREDAIAVTDGGGRKTAALNPIMGADKIARFFIGLAGKNAGRDIRIEPTLFNGTAGALLYLDGELDHTFSMALDGDRIAAIYIVRNPDKLRHVPTTAQH